MLVIGIAGGTGCGKSTVVREIIRNLPDNEVAGLTLPWSNTVVVDVNGTDDLKTHIEERGRDVCQLRRSERIRD